MKIWDKIKYPLLMALIILLLALVRYLAIATPSWWTGILAIWDPLLMVRILSQDLFDSDIVLDILFILASLGAAMLVPCAEKWNKLRRYLLRPVLAAVAVMIISTVAINANDDSEDWFWGRKIDAYCAEVADFLDEADEIILYEENRQNASPYFQDERIRCVCGSYHNTIMIDYDTMRIAFLQHDWINDFFVYELKPGALTEENQYTQLDTLLPKSETRLITYYPDESSSHRTCALELILADGTVYATTDTPDAHWENGYLDIPPTSVAYLFRVGDPHQEYD